MPLERTVASCFLCRVSRAPASLGVRVACIALAGTVGAMGMLGHRRGGAVELFAAGGRVLAGGAGTGLAATVGVMVHAAWMLLWAVVFVAIARHHRGRRSSLEAAAVSVVALASAIVLPATLAGPVATLSIGARVVVHIVLALSLMLGMRLAPLGDVRPMQRVSTSEERWPA